MPSEVSVDKICYLFKCLHSDATLPGRSSDKRMTPRCGQILAADPDLCSFQVCLQKFTSGDKEGRTQREPTLLFFSGAVWFQRGAFISDSECVSRSGAPSRPGNGLQLAEGAGRKVLAGQQGWPWVTQAPGGTGPTQRRGRRGPRASKPAALTELHT